MNVRLCPRVENSQSCFCGIDIWIFPRLHANFHICCSFGCFFYWLPNGFWWVGHCQWWDTAQCLPLPLSGWGTVVTDLATTKYQSDKDKCVMLMPIPILILSTEASASVYLSNGIIMTDAREASLAPTYTLSKSRKMVTLKQLSAERLR